MSYFTREVSKADRAVHQTNIETTITAIVDAILDTKRYTNFEKVHIMNEVSRLFKVKMKSRQNGFYEKGREIRKAMENLRN